MKLLLCLAIGIILWASVSGQGTMAVTSDDKPYNSRILVVGGGGARGAWGAGFAKRLSEKYGPYRVAFGTSTGSLMAPFIVLNDFKTLYEAYTTTTQKKVFNKNPFNEVGDVNFLRVIPRILFGQTLGKSEHLFNKRIRHYVTAERYQTIQNSNENLLFSVSVVDMDSGKVYYKYSNAIRHDSMLRWIWASANEPIFMSYYDDKNTKRKEAYVDGGVLENVPLGEALDYARKNKIYHIDVIVNKPEHPLVNTDFKKRKVINGLNRLIDIWSMEVRRDDILIAMLLAKQKEAQLRNENEQLKMQMNMLQHETPVTAIKKEKEYCIKVYYFPAGLFKGLNQKTLLFEPQRMATLWKAGEESDQMIMMNELKVKSIILGEGDLDELLHPKNF